ncbi:MAG: hypothetical protein WAM79_02105 [Candidatus Sulfotelmatobacter sp.]
MLLLFLLLAASAAAQSPRLQTSHTTESLRGVSAVSQRIIWASGTHGTYLRTINGGRTWTPAQVPGASTLDFRGVVAFSADEAFLMSSGPGDQSHIYHTTDAGRHWQLEFTNANPKGFFDSIAFWDPHHGIVLGDPIPDENGKLKFELLLTDDGQSWRRLPPAELPEALEGEGAFAASNTCLAIHSTASKHTWAEPPSAVHDPNIWFASGGKAARVFHSTDGGKSWQILDTPIVHGPDSAGIFSIAFRSATDGVIAGGDYKHPQADGTNLAFTHDGGKTWQLSSFHPQTYFSAATYGANNHLFVVAQDSILELDSAQNPRRVRLKKNPGAAFNAIAACPQQGAIVVGAKGLIASIVALLGASE